MSLKSIAKTRWKMETDRVTVYPYGLTYILTIAIVIIFAIFLITAQNTGLTASLPLILVMILILALFAGFAGTFILFDNSSGMMKKKLFGFIPVKSIPFDKLHGINVVTNVGGGYNYRMYLKDDRYGKGIVVSSGYSKNDDVNAIEFVERVVPVIHSYLDKHSLPLAPVNEQITSYQYFTFQDACYTIKRNPVGATILGLAFLCLGIHELTPGAWLQYNGTIGKIFIIGFIILIGAIFINAGITKITLDPAARTITRNNPIGIGKKTYSFQNFTGVQTVRKSINFVYAGTEIHLYFSPPEATKQQFLLVGSFKKGRNVERFIKELYSIMDIKY